MRRCIFAFAWLLVPYISNSNFVHAALNFNISSTGDPNADAGFALAAQRWSDIFSDNVTVNITAGFGALNPGVLGQAGSSFFVQSVGNVANSLVADASSATDYTSLSSVSGLTSLTFRTNNVETGVVFTELSADGIQNYEQFIAMTSANAKALGLLVGTNPAADASISFNSNFNFDFDPSDGITPGFFDFVSVAAHEIGHALGFISGVDDIDFVRSLNTNANPADDFTQIAIEDFAIFSTLDMFRFSDLAGVGVRDFAYDGFTSSNLPYLSLTNGLTEETFNASSAFFETGSFNGTGRQASHWRDNLGLGLLDPTLAPGVAGSTTSLDIRALDVIGWNLASVPEPSALAILLCSAGFALRPRRARATL